MSTETIPTHEASTVVSLPVQAPPSASATSPLIERLVTHHGGTWVDETNIDAWSAQGGDCVVLFAGDPVQFPMGLDVAVVLPELRSALKQNFRIGAVQRDNEAALARRYGSQRWPTLMFLRDGQYVTTLSGMHDWEDFVREMQTALAQAPSRAPTIGIPVVNGNAASSCH
ncbi:thioredoxin domain-containing protein [Rhodoferax sp. GW822-FHT02A01]|uniref:thioredoxin domain-containing protein n=1 Tax=Rhodoferax sp. GW822-FHT02A01 TaxID=3141537 RepID=UPI00315C65DC